MDWRERLAITGLILILIGLPGLALGYQFLLRPALADVRTIDIVAAAPEAGGFQPDSIRVAAGETVRLRFSVPDVVHGIAFGPGLDLDSLGSAGGRTVPGEPVTGSSRDLGPVDPGEVQEVEITFDRPGRYTFYCNTWCSPNHWRMRGVIEVYDPTDPGALVVDETPDPVMATLLARGVDIDAPHQAPVVPTEQPLVVRGAGVVEQLDKALPSALTDPAWRQRHSPAEAWAMLVEAGLDEVDAWDVVAYLWLAELDAAQQETAAALYAKNCAACHGETGDGKGPGADALAVQGLGPADPPAAFADPRTMLGGTSEIYYAKLRRGGMGTGMPSFGPLFTSQETWALVGYLWTFVFDNY